MFKLLGKKTHLLSLTCLHVSLSETYSVHLHARKPSEVILLHVPLYISRSIPGRDDSSRDYILEGVISRAQWPRGCREQASHPPCLDSPQPRQLIQSSLGV